MLAGGWEPPALLFAGIVKGRILVSEATIVYDLIDRIMDYLEDDAMVIKPATEAAKRDRLSLWDFDGAEVFVEESFGLESRNDVGYFGDVHPRDLPRPLDVAMIQSPLEADRDHVLLTFQHFRQVPMSAVRGFKVHSPYIIEHRGAFLHKNGVLLTNRGYLEMVKPMVWQRLIGDPIPYREGDSWRAQMILGVQFTRYYQWMVSFRKRGRPSILIPTDPTGIRELFRLREVPEGRERRAALKHWVSAHWRKKRDNPEDKVYVRQHLRGAETFDWLGLECTIYPSQDALDRIARGTPMDS